MKKSSMKRRPRLPTCGERWAGLGAGGLGYARGEGGGLGRVRKRSSRTGGGQGREFPGQGGRVEVKDLRPGGEGQGQAQGSYIVTAILLATLLLSIELCYPLVTS